MPRSLASKVRPQLVHLINPTRTEHVPERCRARRRDVAIAMRQQLAGIGWRKRVGIEPTAAGVSPQPDGFEGRADHQTRIASEAAWPRGRPVYSPAGAGAMRARAVE